MRHRFANSSDACLALVFALTLGARAVAGEASATPVPRAPSEVNSSTTRLNPSGPPNQGPPPREMSLTFAGAVWSVAQLVPSPLLVLGKQHVGLGLRWQVTPLLYSFGIAERPLRAFLVSPIARHSGSVEFHASPEWACCDRAGSGWLLRGGLRLYLPLLEYGERLSWSLGSSYYRTATGHGGFAADLGFYTLFGVLGLNLTLSPALARRELVAALNVRYF